MFLGMTYRSILFLHDEDRLGKEEPEAPEFFTDLNLDQVVRAITIGRQQYRLEPYLYTPLTNIDAISYRHEVMKDLESKSLLDAVQGFATALNEVRRHLDQARKLRPRFQFARWYLDAVSLYCESVSSFVSLLTSIRLDSRGLVQFRDYATQTVNTNEFQSMYSEARGLTNRLAAIRYGVRIHGNSVEVHPMDIMTDYGKEVSKTFARFQHGTVKDYRVKFHDPPQMNSVEERILDLVATLFPDTFRALDQYVQSHEHFMDSGILQFDREVQFYIGYLDVINTVKRMKLEFCYPRLTDTSKEISADSTFDLALAHKRAEEHGTVVCNNFSLQDPERVFIVSGPNQGGKTTFARMIGQLHYLAQLGVPVPGRAAQLFLVDQLFTHFEREENADNRRSKLEDDLLRMQHILRHATSRSLLILNETFSSTSLEDALFLGRTVLEQIASLDAFCVYVTFMDELSEFNASTVSVMSTVDPNLPASRTYTIIRRKADGRAFALSLAERHGLTYDRLKERIQS